MSEGEITRIDLLRHGKLETEELFCAPANTALSQQGWQDLAEITHGKKWDIIISSDFERCCSFAKKLAETEKIELCISSGFQEMNFGRWTGMPTKDIWLTDKKRLSKLWSHPDDFIAPGGESLKNFNKRVKKTLFNNLKQHQGKSILIITHAGVIRSILATALNISQQSALKFNIAYAQLTRLHYYLDGEFFLQSLAG